MVWRRLLTRRAMGVVFLGDSITEQWLGADPSFWRGRINSGIGGETTVQMRARFDADVVATRPKVVHIMAGTNDLWHGDPGDEASRAIGNVDAMVDMAKAAGIAIVLAAPPPVSIAAESLFGHPELFPTLRAGIEGIARRQGLVHVDYARSLCGADGQLVATYTTDGVHLTRQGYRAMRRQAEEAISAAR